MVTPSADVLDLFVVPDTTAPLGDSVVAGDLVLTPGRDAAVHAWLSPLIARLAVTLDSRPGRHPRDLRIAVPVPARDGAWVVDGWAASRYEPGTVLCRDLEVTLAAGRLLHAELDSWVRERPQQLAPVLAEGPTEGIAQLVHADLFGRVCLDPAGAPVVLDVTPAWAPVGWAEERWVRAARAARAAHDPSVVR